MKRLLIFTIILFSLFANGQGLDPVLKQGLKISGFIGPLDPNDTQAPTHLDSLGNGGLIILQDTANYTARNAKVGGLVFQRKDSKFYQWNGSKFITPNFGENNGITTNDAINSVRENVDTAGTRTLDSIFKASSEDNSTAVVNDIGLELTGNSVLNIGNNTIASPMGIIVGVNNSITGSNTTYAFAFGENNNVKNLGSTAFGVLNDIPGRYAFASGLNLYSNGYGEASFGIYNTDYLENNGNVRNSDRLFSIGNGSANNARNNAFEIWMSGKATVDTTWTYKSKMQTYPFAGLEFVHADWVLDQISDSLATINSSDVTSSLVRNEISDSLAAFRNNLDTAGTRSLDSIFQASKVGSLIEITGGVEFNLLEQASINVGNNIVGSQNLAFGTNNTAQPVRSFAFGSNNTVTGSSVSSGAMGSSSEITNCRECFSIGGFNIMTGSQFATTIGFNNYNRSYAETVIGIYSKDYTPISANGWNLNDRLFVIANGTAGFSSTRNNAFEMLKSGTATIDTVWKYKTKMFDYSYSGYEIPDASWVQKQISDSIATVSGTEVTAQFVRDEISDSLATFTGGGTVDTTNFIRQQDTAAMLNPYTKRNVFLDSVAALREDIGSSGGSVTSVNTQTGVVVLDADDIDDAASTHKFTTEADITRLLNTSGTNTGDQDLSNIENDLATLQSQVNPAIIVISGNRDTITNADAEKLFISTSLTNDTLYLAVDLVLANFSSVYIENHRGGDLIIIGGGSNNLNESANTTINLGVRKGTFIRCLGLIGGATRYSILGY
jgi:hypothetical protein